MTDRLKILRLNYLDYSQQRIADSAHCSRHTIRKVLEVASKANIHWPLDEDITNAELEWILFPDKYQKISTYVEPDYPYIHCELAKPGFIPDNCKTATTSNIRYETVLNRSYQELAEYYGTAIVPARVRKPQDKSAAEASVRLVETWIIAALWDRKFFSLRELNEAVAEKLKELNNRKFKQHTGTCRSAYLEEEKVYMLPLPTAPFEAAVWSAAKVPNDYLVSDGRSKYSVPYNLIGEKVNIRVTKTIVEVYFRGSRVASHRRLQTKQREPLMKLKHMPQEHQKYLMYNADDFKT